MNILKGLRSRYITIKGYAKLYRMLRQSDMDPVRVSAVIRHFETALGGSASYKNKLPTSSKNEAWPWYTYPAIEYLSQYDFSSCAVFEYGSGNSSRFWADRALSVTSVESNPTWYETVKSKLAVNQNLLLRPEINEYVNCIHSGDKSYEVVIIDGVYRFNCAMEAIKGIISGGLIILDNTDWYPNTANFLREQGFMQIDLIGWGPINPYAWCTSVFTQGKTKIPRRNQEAVLVLDGIHQVGKDDKRIQ